MQNKKYLSGRRKEYELKKNLEDEGYIVLRTAGSKGPFDLIAFNHQVVRFIQVKYTQRKRQYKNEIQALNDIQLPEYCTKELWVYTYASGWETYLILPL